MYDEYHLGPERRSVFVLVQMLRNLPGVVVDRLELLHHRVSLLGVIPHLGPISILDGTRNHVDHIFCRVRIPRKVASMLAKVLRHLLDRPKVDSLR